MKSKRARKVAGTSRIHRLALAWAKAHTRMMAELLKGPPVAHWPHRAVLASRLQETRLDKLLNACIREMGKGRVRVSRSGAGAKKKGK